MDHYEQFMKQALALARKAGEQDEVPVGAVVVDIHGEVIGRGYNLVEQSKTQQAHAEMLALQEATQTIGNWRLSDCWLYVTLQPCAMCMGMVRLSRLAGVVFGAFSPLFGYHLDNELFLQVYKKDVFSVVSGICAEDVTALMRQFFIKKREKSEC